MLCVNFSSHILYKSIISKILILIIFSPYINIGWSQCSGCNILFNMCDELINNYDSCSENDIYILEDIIIKNNLDEDLINLGYQEWSNGRLKSLILMNNNIYELPKTFGELTYLEGLDLEFNSLITLPKSIGNLISLKYLDISSNKIEYLPDTFFALSNLKTFGLYNNNLSYIQEELGLLTNLNFINLSFNELVEIPDEICNLEKLTWSENWIDLNFSYLYHNSICPPYPECIEEYIGFQDISACESECLVGDLNNDSSFNILDIIAMVNQILSDEYNFCSDTNYDEENNILDIINLINIILSLP